MDGIGAVNRHPDTILFCCLNLQLQVTSIAASVRKNNPCLPVFDCHFSRISQLTNVKIGVSALYYKRLYQNKTSENAIFSPISPFYTEKRAGNYNNKKERRKYPAIHINVPPIRSHNPPFHQICHIQMVYQATEMDKIVVNTTRKIFICNISVYSPM